MSEQNSISAIEARLAAVEQKLSDEWSEQEATIGVDTQADKYASESLSWGHDGKVTDGHSFEVPYRLSEKSVFDMWVSVKNQAENALQFLFATAATEIHKKKDVLSKWIVVVYEDQVYFERFENGEKVETYAPVSPAKAAVYATAIVNGLEPPKFLRQCDKSVLEKPWPMTLEEFRAAANKPQEGGAREAFIKMETERANLLLQIQEEQESSLKST